VCCLEMSQSMAWPSCWASPSLGDITGHVTAMPPAVHRRVITMSRPHLQHVLQPRHKFLGFSQCPCPLPSPHLQCAWHWCFIPVTRAVATSSHEPHQVTLAMARSPTHVQQEDLFNKSLCFSLIVGLDDLRGLFQR